MRKSPQLKCKNFSVEGKGRAGYDYRDIRDGKRHRVKRLVRLSRSEAAGVATAKALAEMIHLMYQNDTAARFWRGLMRELHHNQRTPNTDRNIPKTAKKVQVEEKEFR